MKIAIRYYSESGNTKKLADKISEVTGSPAKTVDTPIDENVDVLFLGSAVYGGGVKDEVKNFISALDPEKVKKVVCFSTAALMPSSYSQVAKLLKAQNISVDDKEFHCRGEFKFVHKGRPNEQDLSDLEAFVHHVI